MSGKAPPSDYYASANNNGSATPAVIAEAEPLNAAGTNIDNTNGAARFYCSKCRAPYDLPNGASSWRCSNCGHFNSTTPDQMVKFHIPD